MAFVSDRQRKAFFAGLNSGTSSSRFSSFPSDNVLSTPPKYVYDKRPIDQFSERSDIEGIIRNLKKLEKRGSVSEDVRNRAHEQRVSLERNLSHLKFDDEGRLMLPLMEDETKDSDEAMRKKVIQMLGEDDESKFSQVTQEQIDSYMRRHGLKSVPDPQLVAEEDAADRFRMIGGKTVYITPPDTAEDFREYEIGQMRRLNKEKRFADAPEALQTQHGSLFVKPEFLDAVSQPIKMVPKKDYTAKILGLDRQEPRGVSLGDYATEMSAQPVQREAIPGGYGSGMPDEMFDQEQLAKGIEVEKEHVIKFTDKGNIKKFKQSDLEKAKEISKDHLSEIPDYYDRLEKLEEQAKADGGFIDVVAMRKEAAA